MSVKANGESRSTAGPAGRQAGRLAVTIRNDNNGASYLHRHVVAAAALAALPCVSALHALTGLKLSHDGFLKGKVKSGSSAHVI